MILELDVGNSFIKWRVLGKGATGGPVQRAESLAVLGLQLRAAGVFCAQGRVCMVRSARSRQDELDRLLAGHVKGSLVYAESGASLAGVTNGYEDPSELGVDRWLAVVAGYRAGVGACLVVDAGTAITADYVTEDGRHLGGMIAPGYSALAGVLGGTTGLEAQALGRSKQGAQQNTQDCLTAGINAMAGGFVCRAVTHAQGLFGPGCRVVLCGGDADTIRSLSGVRAPVMTDLVFRGLALACPF